MSRDTGNFIATSRRNPAYYSRDGYWIARSGRQWKLLRRPDTTQGRQWELIATFPTLTAAVAHHREMITP
jgi:hypothetical protein